MQAAMPLLARPQAEKPPGGPNHLPRARAPGPAWPDPNPANRAQPAHRRPDLAGAVRARRVPVGRAGPVVQEQQLRVLALQERVRAARVPQGQVLEEPGQAVPVQGARERAVPVRAVQGLAGPAWAQALVGPGPAQVPAPVREQALEPAGARVQARAQEPEQAPAGLARVRAAAALRRVPVLVPPLEAGEQARAEPESPQAHSPPQARAKAQARRQQVPGRALAWAL